jgi:hypothetical protein
VIARGASLTPPPPRVAARGLAEVRGSRGVDELPFDALRQSRVGEDGAREARRRPPHLLERVEADERPDPAVDPHRVDTGSGECSGRRLRRRAIDRDQLLAERHVRDDGQVADAPRDLDAEEQLVKVAERLEREQVRAALQQPFDLLQERGLQLGTRRPLRTVQRRGEGTDRASDEDLPTRHVARLARDLRASPVEPRCLVGEPVVGEPEPIRPERVRLDDVRARGDVLAVARADQVRPRLDELVQRRTLRDPAAEEQRPHRTVEQERSCGEAIGERSAGVGERRGSHGDRVARRVLSPARRSRPSPPSRGGSRAGP